MGSILFLSLSVSSWPGFFSVFNKPFAIAVVLNWWSLVIFHKFICPNAMKLPPNQSVPENILPQKWHTKIPKSPSSGTSSFCGGVLIYISNVFKCALHKSGSHTHTRKRWVNCQVNFKAAKTSQSLKDQSITQRLISACNPSIYFLLPVLATEHRTFVRNVSCISYWPIDKW